MGVKSPSQSTSRTTSSQQPITLTKSTFGGVGSLIKLLPTGTVFMFQFLNPVLTNDGKCHTVNKCFSAILIGACGLSCCFSCFTDSYRASDGSTRYGIVTPNGLWPSTGSGSTDLSSYRLRVADFVHGLLSVVVFAVLALLDTNTVRCFYPSFESTEKTLISVMPTVIGAISSTVFVLFPSSRNGIGYPSTDSSSTAQNSSAPLLTNACSPNCQTSSSYVSVHVQSH